MLNAKASHDQTVEGHTDGADKEVTIDGLTKKYPWWMPKTSSEKTNEVETTKVKSVLKCRNTFV
jgi:hypothetical protein